MFLIVGLGNPGIKYAMTRHNVGFWVVDELASRRGLSLEEIKFQSFISKSTLENTPFVLAKPLTYMNRSGIAVAELARFYKIPAENILVVYDDMDLPVGRLRLRPSGGSGGHKGMGSIITRLGIQEIPRLRLGIGRQEDAAESQAVQHVLSRFSREEEETIHRAVLLAADAVEAFVVQGLEEAMNKYNAAIISEES